MIEIVSHDSCLENSCYPRARNRIRFSLFALLLFVTFASITLSKGWLDSQRWIGKRQELIAEVIRANDVMRRTLDEYLTLSRLGFEGRDMHAKRCQLEVKKRELDQLKLTADNLALRVQELDDAPPWMQRMRSWISAR